MKGCAESHIFVPLRMFGKVKKERNTSCHFLVGYSSLSYVVIDKTDKLIFQFPLLLNFCKMGSNPGYLPFLSGIKICSI